MITKQLEPWAFKPQERAAAKAAGEITYFTGRPCKHGHVTFRYTTGGNCHECNLLLNAKHRINNPEKTCERSRLKYIANREKNLIFAKKYREENPEKIALAGKKWRDKNKDVKSFSQQIRNANKQKATPSWLSSEDLNWIRSYYKEAQNHKNMFGIVLAVDHIVPLKGKTVCGLHVPWNLCLRTKSDNSKKSNKLTNEVYLPKQSGILVAQSALPWNLKKETQNVNLL
jgi:hypothetical protein